MIRLIDRQTIASQCVSMPKATSIESGIYSLSAVFFLDTALPAVIILVAMANRK